MRKNNPKSTGKKQDLPPDHIQSKNRAKKTPVKRSVATTLNVNSAPGNTPAADLSASIGREQHNQQSTPAKNMEVHHHPQLHHKPKPWKEYLLEGFMIFIAVMMGFIAESIREDITNNEHTRQLTSQLVQDLKADTVKLNEMCRGETRILKNNDTLFNLLSRPLKDADLCNIQKLVVGSHSLWPFHSSNGAIAAIKNELHLKQLSNSNIISYISNYEGHIDLLHTVQDISLEYQRSFLDPFLRFHFTPDNLNAAFNRPADVTGQMRNLKQEDLTQLRADMVLIRINTKELIDDNRRLMNDAIGMLKYVIKQYDLENE